MKKFMKMMTVVLSLALCMCAFAGCSSYNSILKAFEKEEYEEVEKTETAKSIEESMKDDDVTVTVHVLKKGLTNVAIILEFGSSKDLQKQLDDNETIKGLISDAQKSDLVNGNCLLIPIGLDAKKMIEIFKNA